MKEVGGAGDERREIVAVEVVNVLKVKLESRVAMQPGFAKQSVVHARLGFIAGGECMELFLVKESHDWRHGQIVTVRNLKHRGVGRAGQQAVFVNLVPGGNEQV